ncbi:MAG: YhjD/YihY/BrkB family envelope integrity protein, partial [Rhodothermaceae bacterium]
NGIFGVSKDKGAFIGILRDFGMVILLIVFLLLSNVILPGLNILFDFADNIDFLKSFQISEFLNFVFSFFSFVIIFVLFYVFYTLIPYEKLGRKVPAVAALWATILWEGMRSIFGYYVTNFLSTNKLYGAFLLIAVVAFWIFYSSVLFVLGAEIGQLYRERCEARSKKKGDNVSAK